MDDEEANLDAGTKGAEKKSLGRTISSNRDLLVAIMDFYARNPNVIGGGDILAITDSTPTARAGMVAASLAGIVIEGDERAIQRVVVVIPPGGDVALADGLVWSSFVQSFESLARRPFRHDEEAWFRDRLIVHAAPTGRHASLLELVAGQAERTALIVVEAAGYRDDTIAPFVPSGARAPLIPEDVWVPQVHALAVAAAPLALERKLYVVLDINESSPIRPELGDLLLSIDAFGVVGSTADASAEAVITQRIDYWERWVARGQAGRALADVDALPPVADAQKPFLKVQLLHKAGLRLEALTLIRTE